MTNLSNYDKSNQIEIVHLTIKKPTASNVNDVLDITALMDQFIIYEDMLQNSISARLIYRDQVNLIGTLPIVGGEEINIKFKTPIYSDYIDLTFIVNQIGERVISNDSANIQMNQLILCTPEVWWAVNNDMNAAYKGTYSDIIKKLVSDIGTKKKLVDEEQSIGINEYVAPSLSAFKAIKFCSSRANTKSSSPLFFWESNFGYHMKSLKSIYDTEPVKTVYIEDRSISGINANADKVFNTVYSYNYPPSNNRLRQFEQCAFSDVNVMVDLTNARIIKVNNTYENTTETLGIKLGKFALNDDAKSIRDKDDVYMSYRKDLSHLTSFTKESNITLMDNVALIINVPGDSGLKTGDIIYLDVPSRVGTEITKEKHLSGKWLVRSIKHLIMKTEYSQVCEITKDSFDAQVRE